MPKKINTLLYLKSGKLSIIKEGIFRDALKIADDGRYFLTLEKVYHKRSTLQNNSIWGIPYKHLQECLIESWGRYVKIDEVHEFCKLNFLPQEYIDRLQDEYMDDDDNKVKNLKTGDVKMIPFRLTTTKMTTVESMEYYKNMQDFAMDYFNCDIPDPDPEWKENLNK